MTQKENPRVGAPDRIQKRVVGHLSDPTSPLGGILKYVFASNFWQFLTLRLHVVADPAHAIKTFLVDVATGLQ